MSVIQKINLPSGSSEPTIGGNWVIGTSKSSRKIAEQNLPADYILTSINVNCRSLIGGDGSNPAIIRVYQYGRESSAVMIEITGVGEFIQPINLIVASRYGVDRKVIVDAWDPDTTSPNNTCSLVGTVSVSGRPQYETIGGNTTN